ncbi:MAG: hypothetical protein PVH42_03835 [Desulfobacterales bacterium]|jgi:hypothetical protein
MRKKSIIISCILAAGIIFSGLALAGSQRTGHHKGHGFRQHHKSSGLLLLARYQQKNLRVQVLSELTEQPVEAIQLKLKNQRLRCLMKELNIDRQTFRDAMQAKEKELINQAAVDGSITPKQESEILSKIENRNKRRELMSKLIEKGIENGTITRDEARMLMHNRR